MSGPPATQLRRPRRRRRPRRHRRGSGGTLRYFENTGSAIAPAFTERAGAANPFNGVNVGLRSTPTFADLDGDGDLDAVVGENDGNLNYFKNTGAGFEVVANITAEDDAARSPPTCAT